MCINVSFYLLSPEAKDQASVYVSISKKLGGDKKRLRFNSGHSFVASYCNIRNKKGGKELLKRNSQMYDEYSTILQGIKSKLNRTASQLVEADNFSLEQVRKQYYLNIGRLKDDSLMSIGEVIEAFIRSANGNWGDKTLGRFNTTFNHLKSFADPALAAENVTVDFWNSFRDYLIRQELANTSINKNLKQFKQLISFTVKKDIIKHKIDFDELQYLNEVAAFKIALTETEVETLLNLDLSAFPHLDQVRDLFLLEVNTGQRFSDLPKLLDKNNLDDGTIKITQQKTGMTISVPIHPRLEKHLKNIFEKYPNGLPSLTNQQFNKHLKDICKIAGGTFNRKHTWTIQKGKKKIQETAHRWELCTSHVGRRSFATLSLNRGIAAHLVKSCGGWLSDSEFNKYIKISDNDLKEAYNKF